MGIPAPAKQQARVTSTLYYSAVSPDFVHLPGTSSAYYQVRDTTNRRHYIDLARGGVVDLGIAIGHDLTASGVGVSLYVAILAGWDNLEGGGAGVANSQSVVLTQTQSGVDDLPKDGRYLYLPEVSFSPQATANYKVFSVPELRQPLSHVVLSITARTAPDAGALKYRLVRRY